MRKEGLGPAEINWFVGTLYLPWAFKWIVGPIVDVVYSDQLGRRRAWIVAMQTMMVLCLFGSIAVDFSTQLRFFTAVIFAVNIFAATQDVAIDALACTVLPERERGVANGLMFAGAYTGQAVGGSGVLFLSAYLSFSVSSMLAIGSILMITLFIALPLREKKEEPRPVDESRSFAAIGKRIHKYAIDAGRAFLGHRSATVALVLACLPCGAMALSLALASNLAVELGMTEEGYGALSLISTILAAACCILGGYLSDHFGRKKMLALTAIGMAIPTAALAFWMFYHGAIWPVDPTDANHPPVAKSLITAFIVASIGYTIFQGLMFGIRSALYMDVCTPEVAATQFTAYMALMNFVIFYTAVWQGWALENWGYPVTLALDALAGTLYIILLPWIVPIESESYTDPPRNPSCKNTGL
jgi:MFS family permease